MAIDADRPRPQELMGKQRSLKEVKPRKRVVVLDAVVRTVETEAVPKLLKVAKTGVLTEAAEVVVVVVVSVVAVVEAATHTLQLTLRKRNTERLRLIACT